jgi:hypothetical protein
MDIANTFLNNSPEDGVKPTFCQLTMDTLAFRLNGGALQLGLLIYKALPFPDLWNKEITWTMKDFYEMIFQEGLVNYTYKTFTRYIKQIREGGFLHRAGRKWAFHPVAVNVDAFTRGIEKIKKYLTQSKVFQSTPEKPSDSMPAKALPLKVQKSAVIADVDSTTPSIDTLGSHTVTVEPTYEVVEEVKLPEPILWDTVTPEECLAQDTEAVTDMHPVTAYKLLTEVYGPLNLDLEDSDNRQMRNYVAMVVFWHYFKTECNLEDISLETLQQALIELPVDWHKSNPGMFDVYKFDERQLSKMTYLRTLSDESVRACGDKVLTIGSNEYRETYAHNQPSKTTLKYGFLKWFRSLLTEFDAGKYFNPNLYAVN